MKLTPQRSYLLCFFAALLLDQVHFFGSEHFYEVLRQPLAFAPFPPEFAENIPFVLTGFVLIPVMFYWRKLIRYVARVFLLWLYDINEGTYKHEMFKSLVPLHKYEENFWLGFHYTFVTVIEIVVLKDMPIWPPLWSESTRHAINPAFTVMVDEQRENAGIKFIYLVQFTYYFMELVLLVVDTQFAAKRRKDAAVLFFHHVYTVILLGVSWLTVNHRIGLLVLFFHDLPDIFLPVAKCFSYQEQFVRKFYSEDVQDQAKIIGMAPFVLFVVTLVIFRVILYPILIAYGIYHADWCMAEYPEVPLSYRPHGAAIQVVLITFLMMLYPLHIFWLSLIIKMVPRVLSEQYDDVRSSHAGSDVSDRAMPP